MTGVQTCALPIWASRCSGARKLAQALFETPPLPVETLGLRFPNPVGLAAGMDKQAVAVPLWEALGFGFSELGGVTAHAQPGNPQPRMFRHVADGALVNRMGFNNGGATGLAERLITVTPLQFNMTRTEQLSTMKNWTW